MLLILKTFLLLPWTLSALLADKNPYLGACSKHTDPRQIHEALVTKGRPSLPLNRWYNPTSWSHAQPASGRTGRKSLGPRIGRGQARTTEERPTAGKPRTLGVTRLIAKPPWLVDSWCTWKLKNRAVGVHAMIIFCFVVIIVFCVLICLFVTE